MKKVSGEEITIIQELLDLAPPISSYCYNELKNFKALSDVSKFIGIKYRRKEIDRFVEKIEARWATAEQLKSKSSLSDEEKQKLEKCESYSWEKVTDVCGFRLVCLYRSDFDNTISALIKCVLSRFSENRNLRKPPEIREAIYHYSFTAPEAQQRAYVTKKKITALFKEKNIQREVQLEERADYSSFHLVVNFFPTNSQYVIPVEFQVRTILTDAWSDFDHDLRYSESRLKNEFTSSLDEDSQIKPEAFVIAEKMMPAFKYTFDSLEHQIETLKWHIKGPKKTAHFSKITSSMDDYEVVIKTISSLGSSESDWSNFLQVYKEKVELDNEASISLNESEVRKYMFLAEKLNEEYKAFSQAGAFRFSEQWESVDAFIFYTIRMEEALCRMKAPSDRVDEFRQANQIYASLADIFSDIPSIPFRTAQSCFAIRDYSGAVENMKLASNLLSRYEAGELSIVSWKLTSRQYNWMKRDAKELLGAYIWNLTLPLREKLTKRSISEQELDTLGEYWWSGLSASIEGLPTDEDPQKRIQYLNNILGFSNEFLEAKANYKGVFSNQWSYWIESVQKNYKQFLDEFGILVPDIAQDDANFLNTLAEAYLHMGNKVDACRVNEHLGDLIADGKVNMETATEKLIVQSCLKIQKQCLGN